jgi:hypothetical protein
MIWVELLACVVIWLSFWSLIPRDEWWFRGADFPRLQILALGLIAFILMLVWDAPWDWVREVILAGVNCGSGVPTQNGVALYLCVEKAG